MSRVIFESEKRITSPYGQRGNGFHNGVDEGWRSNENYNKVYANSRGKVVSVVTGMKPMPASSGSYGNYVKIDHLNGYYSLYAHLRSVNVKVGDIVDENTQIGVIGESGATIDKQGIAERHLHFEVFKGSTKINPTPYLTQSIASINPNPKPTPSTGDAVIKMIQEVMNARYNTGLIVDGYYGTQTKKALVKGLQSELNKQYGARLNVDGIFGNVTKNACVSVRIGSKGRLTYVIQGMLYCKGYNTNGVDGVFGNGTLNAVKSFQKNNGLSQDGIVGKNTFEKLFK